MSYWHPVLSYALGCITCLIVVCISRSIFSSSDVIIASMMMGFFFIKMSTLNCGSKIITFLVLNKSSVRESVGEWCLSCGRRHQPRLLAVHYQPACFTRYSSNAYNILSMNTAVSRLYPVLLGFTDIKCLNAFLTAFSSSRTLQSVIIKAFLCV